MFTFPYFLYVYRRLLETCTSLDEVRVMHSDYYHESRAFRIFRPRFHVIKKALLPLDVTASDVAVREASKTVRPIAWIPTKTKAPTPPTPRATV